MASAPPKKLLWTPGRGLVQDSVDGLIACTRHLARLDGYPDIKVVVIRTTAQVTYQANERLAMSLAGRYQGKMYSTLDNTDYVSGVQGAFDPFFVMDAKLRYQIVDAVSFDVGIDNLTDAKYFLFHPFPGRTYLASLKLKL